MSEAKHSEPDSATALLEHYQQRESDIEPSQALRAYRAISWLRAAEQDPQGLDMQCIQQSIALNCLIKSPAPEPDLDGFAAYIVAHDQQRHIYQLLLQDYTNKVRRLIKNPFLYPDFWQQLQHSLEADNSPEQNNSPEPKNSPELDNSPAPQPTVIDAMPQHWRASFDQQSVAALNALSRKRSDALLAIVLQRLQLLNHQLLDGGASFESRVNRQQLADAVSLLQALTPCLIRICLNAQQPWQAVAYPVVDQTLWQQANAD